jgi:peptide/nickel transport system substrate-binding protein
MQRRDFLASGLAALAAPSIARAQGGSVLRFIPQADLAVLDPIWTTAYVTRNHGYMVFDTLYGWDSKFRATPQMVAGHVMENDGKIWRLTLRDGLRFHDGAPVLARDCVASVQRWAKRDNFGRLLMASTEELSTADDRTIVFRLKAPFPQLPDALGKATNTMAAIMPERLAATDPFKQVPELVGSGPFRFKADERVAGDRVAYERFAGYVPREDGLSDWTAGPKRVNVERVEWHVMPESATAAAALRTGAMDWWEVPALDLLGMLRADKGIIVRQQDPSGFIGVFRMNQLIPPFDNPAIRRALLGAIDQSEFCQASAGDDPALWRDHVGFFCPGTPMANDAGLAVLTGKRDVAAVRAAIKAAGYAGEKVVVMGAADAPILKAVADVTADLLQRCGFNVDYAVADWGTVIQRRTSKVGWNAYSFVVSGMDQATPTTNSNLWTGAAAGPGWPVGPRLESLSAAWLAAPDLAAQQGLARDIQVQAFQDVPYVPLGQTLQPTAYRSRITGVMQGFPVFWNVAKG